MGRPVPGAPAGRVEPTFRQSFFTVPALLASTLVISLLQGTVASELKGAQRPSSDDSCDIRPTACWNLYTLAEDTLGVRDEHFGHDPTSIPTAEDINRRCIALRTYNYCVENMTRPCRGDLNFQSMKNVISLRMEESNCSREGPIFKPTQLPDPSDPPQVCSYSGHWAKKLCLLYGDPHLRSFDGEFALCRAAGTWPLINNDYLIVQVTNQATASAVTAISEVTVIVKAEDCASDEYASYQAPNSEGVVLPINFEDGRSYFGPERSVQITEVVHNQHVEIYLRYINTTVSIRRHGRFFSLAVSMPEAVINKSIERHPNAVSLCRRGCPAAQQIDVRTLRPNAPVSGSAMPQNIAEALCKDAGLVDEFYDSCVMDVLLTGDKNFTRIALSAMHDALRFSTSYELHNRTEFKFPLRNSAASVRDGVIPVLPVSVISLCSSYLHCPDRTKFILFILVLYAWTVWHRTLGEASCNMDLPL